MTTLRHITSTMGFIISLTLLAECVPPQQLNIQVDVNADGFSDFEYINTPTHQSATLVGYAYGCMSLGNAKILRGSLTRTVFSEGQIISAGNPIQANQGGFNALVLTYFDYSEISPGNGQCKYFAYPETWNDRLEGLIGLRLQSEEGTHYAWVRFTRPDLEPSTPFQIAGYDWNPVVGAPIEAGLPPPPPPVQFQVLPEGLLLGWDYRFSGLVLECADSLTEPVEWRPVEGVEGNQIILPPDEASRFYRLRRP